MNRLLFLLLVGFLIVLASTQRLCIDVNKECEKDLSCAFAFLQFRHACPHIMETQMDPTIRRNCSSECVEAINILNSTVNGAALYTCNCRLDGKCLTLKARVAKCFMAESRKPSCTMGFRNCSRNGRCSQLKEDFLFACNNMINGVSCADECLGNQTKLMEHELGKPLLNCECDGPTETFCRGLQANAKQLRCLPGMSGTGKPVFKYQHTDIYGEEEDGNSSIMTRPYVLPSALVLLLSLMII